MMVFDGNTSHLSHQPAHY